MKYTDEQVRNYLINHIKHSIIKDVGGAFLGWSQQGNTAGFFAVPRMLFPEIDGLGSYITGKPRDTGLNIKTYLSDVMGKLNPRYKEVAAFMVLVYRHGLLHQHNPKWFQHEGNVIGLQFVIGSPNNPLEVQRRHHLSLVGTVLQFDVNIFYDDVINSMDSFAEDVISKYRDTFDESIKIQSKPLTVATSLKNNKFIGEKDFEFLRQD